MKSPKTGTLRVIHGLYLAFASTFLYGLMEWLAPNSLWPKLVMETSIGGLIVIAVVNRTLTLAPGFVLVAAYTAWAILAGYYAGTPVISSLKHVRFVVYSYLLICCIWNRGLLPAEISRLNKFVLGLIGLQIATSIFKMVVMRGRWEQMVGTMFMAGGGASTAVSLFAMALFFAFYLYSRNPRLLLLVLLSPIVAYASQKRGIYYYIPMLMIAEYIIYTRREKKNRSKATWTRFMVVCGLLSILTAYGVQTTLRLEDIEADSVSEHVALLVTFGWTYSTDEVRGYTTGRFSTTQRVMESFGDGDIGHILLGWGPETVMGTGERVEELQIMYGITGWVRDIIGTGWPGATFGVLFFFFWWRRLRKFKNVETIPYWRALALGVEGCFIVFALMHFTYNAVFTTCGPLTFAMFYFTTLLVSPYYVRQRYAASANERALAKPHPGGPGRRSVPVPIKDRRPIWGRLG